MFAKTIIDSDAFLDMPLSTQCLYFHLSMRADDDGFVNNPKKIQKMLGASEDDLKLLVAKSFVLTFESGVIVIKHWRINNYIRNDRYHETAYQDEKNLLSLKENNAYTINSDIVGIPSGNQTVYQMETEDRLDKDRLDKDRGVEKTDYQQIADLYNDTCVSFPRLKSLSDARKKAIKARLNTYTVDDFKEMFRKVEASDFLKGKNNRDWRATFDWIIKDSNMAKILDGNYDNAGGKDDRVQNTEWNPKTHNFFE